MVQGCPQMDRVHQGRSGLVFLVELMQVFARDLEGGYHALVEADAGQVPAVTEQECPHEDVCGLVVLDWNHLLLPRLIFGGRCGRRRVSSASLAGVWSHQPGLWRVCRLVAFSFQFMKIFLVTIYGIVNIIYELLKSRVFLGSNAISHAYSRLCGIIYTNHIRRYEHYGIRE